MSGLLKSFKWASHGLKYCINSEKNFQVHCCFAAMSVFFGIALKISCVEWILVVMSIAAVLAFEMLNTAIEHLCNIIHPSIHPSVKIIKDVSAGAVFLIAIMAVVCGAIIFIPKIISYLQNS